MNREHRILKNEQFQTIIKQGTLRRTPLCYAYYLPNDVNKLRVGVAVSTKLGNAVIRNKIKRQIRAAVRPYKNKYVGDFIFIAKNEIKNHSYRELETVIARLFDENGVTNEKKK